MGKMPAILLLLLCGPAMSAPDSAKIALAADLAHLTNVDQKAQGIIEETIRTQTSGLGKQYGLSAGDAKLIDTLAHAIVVLVKKDFAGDRLRAAYVAAYANVFTEQELRDLAAFYRSPAGRTWSAKMPQFSKMLMDSIQVTTNELAGEIQKVKDEFARKHHLP